MKFLRYQLPAILFALAIFIQSSIHGLAPPDLGISLEDKLFHAVVYGFFGFTLTRAFYYSNNIRMRRYAILLGIIVGILYAVSDEIHQYFVPGRYAEAGDVVADAIGIMFAQIIFLRKKAFEKREANRRLPENEQYRTDNDDNC
ncbi:MAG: VanZ family protein [candidate division KSB1 bacterium]|jgi:VanZ family protein|nr:VanZ family protein [candidate division KSB1 bacterium]